MKDYKKNIPNALTLSRIVFTPIIIVLGLLGNFKIVIFLAIICALTDFFDGRLARRWNTVSKKGAKFDAVADKIFAIGMTACLIGRLEILIIPLLFEIIIGLTNLYYYYILNRTESLIIGKYKTTLLFISIIISMISVFSNSFNSIAYGFIYSTINLQILCLAFYNIKFNKIKRLIDTTVEDNLTHKKIIDDAINIEDEKTIQINDLIELVKKYDLNKDNNI